MKNYQQDDDTIRITTLRTSGNRLVGFALIKDSDEGDEPKNGSIIELVCVHDGHKDKVKKHGFFDKVVSVCAKERIMWDFAQTKA